MPDTDLLGSAPPAASAHDRVLAIGYRMPRKPTVSAAERERLRRGFAALFDRFGVSDAGSATGGQETEREGT